MQTMRSTLMLAVAGFALIAPIQAQQPDESRAIIDRALKAQGGADKVAALKAFTAKIKGQIDLMGMNLDFTVVLQHQPPAKSKSVIKLMIEGMEIEMVEVVDGDKGWKSTAGDQPIDMDKEEVKEHNEMQHVEEVSNLALITTDKTLKLSPLGESKVGDTLCVGVQVTKKGKRDVKLYFDKKTNLLVKAEYRALDPFTTQEVAQEKLFSAYKELVPGLKMASKELINNDGKRFLEMEITELRPVERHDDSVFARPK
jgi:hypothetical protein